MSLRTEYPSGAAASSSAARFRERELANRRRPWRRALAALVAATVVAVLVWVLGWSSILGVSDGRGLWSDRRRGQPPSPSSSTSRSAPRWHAWTPMPSAARVRERITDAEVSVRRAWPSTLAVDIVLRTPAIVVRNPQGQLEVVDAEGVSFGVVKAAPKGVPVVKAVGAKGATREALQSALALLNALPSDLSSQVSGITVSSANLVTSPSASAPWCGAVERTPSARWRSSPRCCPPRPRSST
jgi:cell division protein FtsQ